MQAVCPDGYVYTVATAGTVVCTEPHLLILYPLERLDPWSHGRCTRSPVVATSEYILKRYRSAHTVQ